MSSDTPDIDGTTAEPAATLPADALGDAPATSPADPQPEPPPGPSAFQWPVAAIGLLILALGLSGLLDDSGVLDHPWWIAPLGAAATVAVALGGRTLGALRTSSA